MGSHYNDSFVFHAYFIYIDKSYFINIFIFHMKQSFMVSSFLHVVSALNMFLGLMISCFQIREQLVVVRYKII